MFTLVRADWGCSDFVGDGKFFFFKQKTAYEVRISDWSSDVCSSDLATSAVPVFEKTYCTCGKLEITRSTLRCMSSDCSIEVDGIRSAGIARFLSSSLGMNSLPMNWNATADSANTPTPIPIVAHGLAKSGRAHVCTPVTNAHLVCR